MENFKKIQKFHDPVLLNEVLDALQVDKYAHLKTKVCFIDATVGLGGHAESIVKKGVFLLGIDADKDSLHFAEDRLMKACPTPFVDTERSSFKLVHGNFRNIDDIARVNAIKEVCGIIFDLGISSYQLSHEKRGFSYEDRTAPLDMRLDAENQGVSAADLLNVLNKAQLIGLFEKVLTKKESIVIAGEVIRKRQLNNFKTVGDISDVIFSSGLKKRSLNPATLPFLALRIAVNSELDNLTEAIAKGFNLLAKKGRLVIISFHSGEDKIVKNFFKVKQQQKLAKIITNKPIIPRYEELIRNPRAKSSKMRILEKL